MSASTLAGGAPTLTLFACASMAALANVSALAERIGPHVRGLDSDDEPDSEMLQANAPEGDDADLCDAVTGSSDGDWLPSLLPAQWTRAPRKIKTPTEADNAAAVSALPRRTVSKVAAVIRKFWETLLDSNDSWARAGDDDGDGGEFVRACRGKMKGGHRTGAWGRGGIASSLQLSPRLCEELMAAFGDKEEHRRNNS